MTKYQVLYFAYSNKNPVKDFIDSLDIKQKDKIFRLFTVIEEYGFEAIPQHIKNMKNNLYSYRDHLKESLKNPEFKMIWKESQVEYLLAKKLIEKRLQKKMS